jgi:hypothetical protein
MSRRLGKRRATNEPFFEGWLGAKVGLALMMAILVAWYAAAPALADNQTGSVMEVYADRMQVEVQASNGESLMFTLDGDSRVYINGAEMALENLQPGDRVSVVFHMDEDMRMATEVRCDR